MITATTTTFSHRSGMASPAQHANFVIHNGAKMISVSVDNSGGAMHSMARADIRLLFSNNTAGIENKPAVEDVTSRVFGGDESDIVRGNVQNMARAMNWLQRTTWGFAQNDI